MDIHFIRGSMGSRTSLDLVEKNKVERLSSNP
jgi:hypothetical protein